MWPARNLASVFRIISYVLSMGLESVVGTAARYGLDGPGIESRWGGDDDIFRIRTDRPCGPPGLLCNQ
jgi:hypothetical protein